VEHGQVTIVGGVRTQAFDVVYRPDGPRFALDSKTLNSSGSWARNWQNMVNDLATEATTLHRRYPDAIAAFIVMVPSPVLSPGRLLGACNTLVRMGKRVNPRLDDLHLAEAMCLFVWDPGSGNVDRAAPDPVDFPSLRTDAFGTQIEERYRERFGHAIPHV
jgi:hypothetical protein